MTAPYNATNLDLIQHMINASKDQITATGTLTERFSALWWGGMAILDPSTQAVPVKILRNVSARPGDRVVLTKYGSDWTVTGSFGTSPLPAPVSQAFGFAGLSTTTSATAVDMPGSPSLDFEKRFDWSAVEVDLRMSSYTNTGGTEVRAGVLVNGVDYPVLDWFHNQVSVHMPHTGVVEITDLPAGYWEFRLRWHRTSGTGDIRVDVKDRVYLRLLEIDVGP